MEAILQVLPDNYDKNSTVWIYKDKLDLYNKYSQIPLVIKEEKLKRTIKKDNNNKTPLELIITYTETSNIMKAEIKQKLIDFITIPEFGKAFGIKKSSEIISALSRDSWNQSMALFISFLLDATVIYKDKSYLFNKEKNLKEIKL